MPREDGTGPRGLGAGTGRGLGPCGSGRRGLGVGFARGLGRGFGRVFGFRRSYTYKEPSKEEKIKALEQEKADVEEELKEIKKEIEEMNK